MVVTRGPKIMRDINYEKTMDRAITSNKNKVTKQRED
jgi:hypothetical protein